MHDPRRAKPPSTRDIAALAFIGEGFEVAQYQLHAAIFPNLSAVVVSHFVTRASRIGWVELERWNRVGINRLRLTAMGREIVVRAGGDATSLFVPKRPVATKDIAHTLWINDVRVALLAHNGSAFDAVLCAWQLQRRLSPPPAAIPDILAIRNESASRRPAIFACEIDLGGERLVRTFLPKLQTLTKLVTAWSGGAESQILVLTNGARRANAINEFALSNAPAVVAAPLPSVAGPAALTATAEIVATVLIRTLNSN